MDINIDSGTSHKFYDYVVKITYTFYFEFIKEPGTEVFYYFT